MKTTKIVQGLFIFFVGVSAASGQVQFTQTVTASNKGCNNTCSIIEMPELNPPPPNAANPSAMIFITPAGGTPNPHPIGAYFMYQNKWSIKNMDDQAIPEGAKFKVEYFAGITGNSGFSYQVPSRIYRSDPAFIDYSNLNNNPNAQIRVFPVAWFNQGDGRFNRDDVKVQYNAAAKKWIIVNVNGTPVPSGVFYNVVFSTALTPITTIEPNPANGVPLPPGTPAGGDLSGTYPNPRVVGLRGKPLSTVAPSVGQILKWNGTAWEPADDKVAATPVSPPGQYIKPSALYFNQSGMVNMYDPNVNVKSIPGLDNQKFTLAQPSRVVFHTSIETHIISTANLIQSNATGVWLNVEILNSANAVVGRSTSDAWLAQSIPQSINSSGIGILPAGTYHTRVSLNRQPGGAKLDVTMAGYAYHPNQGGQLIIEIFPD